MHCGRRDRHGAIGAEYALSAKERADGWRLLFDGKTAAGWRGYRQQTLPRGWQAIDGALTRVGQAGDIVTIDEFGDFELTLEWKLAANGNSGVFYRVVEDDSVMWHMAPEYQIIDNAYKEPLKPGQLRRRQLRSGSAVTRRHQADRLVERDAHRRTRRACRALAQRREGRRLRAVDVRLGAPGSREQVQGLSEVSAARPAATSGCRTTAISAAFRNIKIRELKN
mgnify:CR=1 FL=1